MRFPRIGQTTYSTLHIGTFHSSRPTFSAELCYRRDDDDGMFLEQECRRVLAANHRVGSGELPPIAYDYTCPSPDTYPFQWCWDSAFHAIVLARLDPDRAQ